MTNPGPWSAGPPYWALPVTVACDVGLFCADGIFAWIGAFTAYPAGYAFSLVVGFYGSDPPLQNLSFDVVREDDRQGWGQSRLFGSGPRVAVWSLSGRRLQAEKGQGLESGAVPGAVAAGSGMVGVAGAVEDADGGVGDGGEQPPGSAGSQLGGVFGEGGVAAVVDWTSHCSLTVGVRLEQAFLGGG